MEKFIINRFCTYSEHYMQSRCQWNPMFRVSHCLAFMVHVDVAGSTRWKKFKVTTCNKQWFHENRFISSDNSHVLLPSQVRAKRFELPSFHFPIHYFLCCKETEVFELFILGGNTRANAIARTSNLIIFIFSVEAALFKMFR